LIKIDRKIVFNNETTAANWYDVNEIATMQLALDHNLIIENGLQHIRHRLDVEPHLLFELLPKKFTISQLRILYDVVHQSRSDVRNFQKKVAQMNNLIQLDEVEEGVPHRAARLYKFERKRK